MWRRASLFLDVITYFLESGYKIVVVGFALVVDYGHLLILQRGVDFLHALHESYVLLNLSFAALAILFIYRRLGGENLGAITNFRAKLVLL